MPPNNPPPTKEQLQAILDGGGEPSREQLVRYLRAGTNVQNHQTGIGFYDAYLVGLTDAAGTPLCPRGLADSTPAHFTYWRDNELSDGQRKNGYHAGVANAFSGAGLTRQDGTPYLHAGMLKEQATEEQLQAILDGGGEPSREQLVRYLRAGTNVQNHQTGIGLYDAYLVGLTDAAGTPLCPRGLADSTPAHFTYWRDNELSDGQRKNGYHAGVANAFSGAGLTRQDGTPYLHAGMLKEQATEEQLQAILDGGGEPSREQLVRYLRAGTNVQNHQTGIGLYDAYLVGLTDAAGTPLCPRGLADSTPAHFTYWRDNELSDGQRKNGCHAGMANAFSGAGLTRQDGTPYLHAGMLEVRKPQKKEVQYWQLQEERQRQRRQKQWQLQQEQEQKQRKLQREQREKQERPLQHRQLQQEQLQAILDGGGEPSREQLVRYLRAGTNVQNHQTGIGLYDAYLVGLTDAAGTPLCPRGLADSTPAHFTYWRDNGLTDGQRKNGYHAGMANAFSGAGLTRQDGTPYLHAGMLKEQATREQLQAILDGGGEPSREQLVRYLRAGTSKIYQIGIGLYDAYLGGLTDAAGTPLCPRGLADSTPAHFTYWRDNELSDGQRKNGYHAGMANAFSGAGLTRQDGTPYLHAGMLSASKSRGSFLPSGGFPGPDMPFAGYPTGSGMSDAPVAGALTFGPPGRSSQLTFDDKAMPSGRVSSQGNLKRSRRKASESPERDASSTRSSRFSGRFSADSGGDTPGPGQPSLETYRAITEPELAALRRRNAELEIALAKQGMQQGQLRDPARERAGFEPGPYPPYRDFSGRQSVYPDPMEYALSDPQSQEGARQPIEARELFTAEDEERFLTGRKIASPPADGLTIDPRLLQLPLAPGQSGPAQVYDQEELDYPADPVYTLEEFQAGIRRSGDPGGWSAQAQGRSGHNVRQPMSVVAEEEGASYAPPAEETAPAQEGSARRGSFNYQRSNGEWRHVNSDNAEIPYDRWEEKHYTAPVATDRSGARLYYPSGR